MTEEARTPERIEGLAVEDAADLVVEREESEGVANSSEVADDETATDRQVVWAALERVTVDGTVRRAGVDEALAHLSKVVSTPETRVELAAIELEQSKEAADDVSDVDIVADRLDRFEERLTATEARVTSLGEELQALVERDDDAPLGEVALEIHHLHEAANAAHRAADELTVDIEEFESWLENEAARIHDLEADVERVGEFLDGVARTVGDVAAATGEGRSIVDDAAVVDDDAAVVDDDAAVVDDDAAAAWADSVLRHRVSRLLVEDLRAELDGVQELARRAADERGDETASNDRTTLEELVERIDDLDDLEDRRASLDDRLGALARAEWRERFNEQLVGFDAVLDDVGTPVDWGVVQRHLEAHREEIRSR